jgi:hypothetical protein
VPAVEAWLRPLDFAVAWQGDKTLPTPGGSLLPALALAMTARVFRLHARLADWLGIREIFDIEVIIHGLAERLGVDLTPLGEARLRAERRALMRKVFYPYVSGPQAAVDSLLVHQALDAWSWLWIGLEATVVWSLAGYALVATETTRLGLQTLAATFAFAVLGLPALRAQCARFAYAQVRAILADPARGGAIRAAFDELLHDGGESKRPDIRLAA